MDRRAAVVMRNDPTADPLLWLRYLVAHNASARSSSTLEQAKVDTLSSIAAKALQSANADTIDAIVAAYVVLTGGTSLSNVLEDLPAICHASALNMYAVNSGNGSIMLTSIASLASLVALPAAHKVLAVCIDLHDEQQGRSALPAAALAGLSSAQQLTRLVLHSACADTAAQLVRAAAPLAKLIEVEVLLVCPRRQHSAAEQPRKCQQTATDQVGRIGSTKIAVDTGRVAAALSATLPQLPALHTLTVRNEAYRNTAAEQFLGMAISQLTGLRALRLKAPARHMACCATQCVIDALPKLTQLTTLELSVLIGDRDMRESFGTHSVVYCAEALGRDTATAIASLPQLQDLSLILSSTGTSVVENTVQWDTMWFCAEMEHMLHGLTALTSLEVCCSGLQEDGAKECVAEMTTAALRRGNPPLQHLKVAQAFFVDGFVAKDLAAALEAMPVTHLDLSHCSFMGQFIIALVDTLPRCTNLRGLALSAAGLERRGIEVIAGALAALPEFKQLDVSNNCALWLEGQVYMAVGEASDDEAADEWGMEGDPVVVHKELAALTALAARECVVIAL